MRIPKVISRNNREYIFVKEYPNFISYKDMIIGVREDFTYYDLGLVKEVEVRPKLRKNMNIKP